MSTRLLWNLQKLDNQLDALNRELSRIEAALREPSILFELRRQIREKEDESTRLVRQQRDLELEMQGLVEQRTNLERRLYGGYISNPREVEAAQQKAEELRHRESTLEDTILQIMMTLETLDQEIRELRDLLRHQEAEWSERERTLLAQRGETEKERAQILSQRSHLLSHLSPQVLTVYERLRATKNGIAVARLQNRVCQACGVEVPVSVEREVKYSQDLVRCPTCGRILVE